MRSTARSLARSMALTSTSVPVIRSSFSCPLLRQLDPGETAADDVGAGEDQVRLAPRKPEPSETTPLSVTRMNTTRLRALLPAYRCRCFRAGARRE